jgi:hypothetical protein
MDTSYFFPDIQRQQLLGQQATGAELSNQFNQQAMPLDYELLRQKVLEGQLGLAGAQQQYAFNSAVMGRVLGGLNGTQPQPDAYAPSAPQQLPSATGGGGSSGGSGGNNSSASPGTSPSSSVNGAAPSSQGAPGFGGGPGGYGSSHDIGSVLGMDPDTQSAIALINPQMGKQIQEAREAQVKTLQLQAQGHINDLETVRNAPNPAAVVMANPGYRALWAQTAPHFGIDPNDMSPQNVQTVFGALANQTRGQVGLPATKYEHYTNSTNQYGQTVQTEDATGKQNVLAGPETEGALVNGRPTTVTKQRAVNEGLEPYNTTTYQQSQLEAFQSSPAGQLKAKMDMLGITLPGGGGGRNPTFQIASLNNIIRNNPGVSVDELAQQLRTGQLDFNGTKRTTAQLSTVLGAADAQAAKLEKDFNAMAPLVEKMGVTGSSVVDRGIAQLRANFKTGGDSDTAQMLVYLKEAASEYAKLNNGMTGGAAPAEGQLNEALDIMKQAFTTGGFEGIRTALMQSAQNKRDAYKEGLKNASRVGAGVGADTQPAVNNVNRTAAGLTNSQNTSASTSANLPKVSSPADLAGLKSGDHFLGPDGIERVKH